MCNIRVVCFYLHIVLTLFYAKSLNDLRDFKPNEIYTYSVPYNIYIYIFHSIYH